jgi:cobalamin biosynthesis protein CobT
MKKYWMIVLALLVITAGCGPQESAERAAQDALQDQKVRAALAKQKKGSMSMPKELKPDSEDGKNSEDGKDSEAPKDDTSNDSTTSDEAKSSSESETPTDPATSEKNETGEKVDAKSEDATKQTTARPKVDAHQVFDEAVATAKADNKAVFVHFTAKW